MENTKTNDVNTSTENVGVTETKEKRFDVEIFEYKTGKVEAVIGKNLTERKAERRVETGLMKCNPNYGVRTVEVSK